MEFILSFTSFSCPSWISPIIFRALSYLNLCLTLLKTSSIGLYSGA